MKVPKGNDVFFPLKFKPRNAVTEIRIPSFSMKKDQEVRWVLWQEVDRLGLDLGAGLLDLGSTLSGTLIKLGSIIFEQSERWIEENLTLSDLVEVVSMVVFEPVTGKRPSNKEQWSLAELLDFCAFEYGFTIQETLELSRWELGGLLEAAASRKSREVKAAGGSTGSRAQPAQKKNFGPDAAESFAAKFGMLKVKE